MTQTLNDQDEVMHDAMWLTLTAFHLGLKLTDLDDARTYVNTYFAERGPAPDYADAIAQYVWAVVGSAPVIDPAPPTRSRPSLPFVGKPKAATPLTTARHHILRFPGC